MKKLIPVYHGDISLYGFEKEPHTNFYNHAPIYSKVIHHDPKTGTKVTLLINGIGYPEIKNNIDIMVEGDFEGYETLELTTLAHILQEATYEEIPYIP